MRPSFAYLSILAAVLALASQAQATSPLAGWYGGKICEGVAHNATSSIILKGCRPLGLFFQHGAFVPRSR